jgi:hypothetical protein
MLAIGQREKYGFGDPSQNGVSYFDEFLVYVKQASHDANFPFEIRFVLVYHR